MKLLFDSAHAGEEEYEDWEEEELALTLGVPRLVRPMAAARMSSPLLPFAFIIVREVGARALLVRRRERMSRFNGCYLGEGGDRGGEGAARAERIALAILEHSLCDGFAGEKSCSVANSEILEF